jgi:hypothetical protein
LIMQAAQATCSPERGLRGYAIAMRCPHWYQCSQYARRQLGTVRAETECNAAVTAPVVQQYAVGAPYTRSRLQRLHSASARHACTLACCCSDCAFFGLTDAVIEGRWTWEDGTLLGSWGAQATSPTQRAHGCTSQSHLARARTDGSIGRFVRSEPFGCERREAGAPALCSCRRIGCRCGHRASRPTAGRAATRTTRACAPSPSPTVRQPGRSSARARHAQIAPRERAHTMPLLRAEATSHDTRWRGAA